MSVRNPRLMLKRAVLVAALIVTPVISHAGTRGINRVKERVPNEYIVVLNDEFATRVTSTTADLAQRFGGKVHTTYDVVIPAFHVTMTDEQALRLSEHPAVKYVEENAVVRLATSPQPLPEVNPATNTPDRWGLSRLDQPSPSSPRINIVPPPGTGSTYEYCSTGSGVRAYVLDTGVLPNHKEFRNATGGSRVDPAPSLRTALTNAGQDVGPQCWENFAPNWDNAANMHGTAVASLLGGLQYGVAKDVTIVDARVFACNDGSVTTQVSRILTALNWIPTDPNRGPYTAVVNLSTSWNRYQSPNSAAVHDAINRLTDMYNCIVTVAAGNNNENTYWYSPGFATRAITVGGSNKASDTKWQYSNWAYVELYAPAQYVEAASNVVQETQQAQDHPRSHAYDCTSNYVESCTSGTSFAAPLVGGLVARYLQNNRTATRDAALAYIVDQQARHTGVTITEPTGANIPLANMNDCVQ